MKRLILLGVAVAILLSVCTFVRADVWVNSYSKSNGTYVEGHYRSNPDGNFNNNWSTKGNINPYTGKKGYKNSPSLTSPSYNSSNKYKW